MKKIVSLSSLPIGAGSRRSICLALVFVSSISLAGAGAAADLAPTADAGGTIVFTSNRDGDWDIYALNPDGSGLTQLTHNKIEDSFPVPSPDGRLIAFDYRGALALMNADGSGRRPVPGCSSFTASSWSADSTRLVCQTNGAAGLAIADAARGTISALTPRGSYATWSPDGHTIAFSDKGLWVVPAVGGAPRRVGHREPWFAASWSPNSQRLAYGAWVGTGRARRLDLFTIGADGSDEQRLVQDIDEPPRWSPEGSLIAFVRRLGKFPRAFDAVYTVRADGSSLQQLTVSPGGEFSREPAWTGDGVALLYVRQRYRGAYDSDVFLTSPGAGASRALTQPFPMGGVNEEAQWLPGPPVSGMPPVPRTVTLPLARKLTLADPVEQVAADGRRAVAYAHTSCGGVLVWNSSTRRAARTPGLLCDSGLRQLVLAGRRLAWISGVHGMSGDYSQLSTLRLGARRSTTVMATLAYSEGGGDDIGNLTGRGRTIAFTSYHNPGGRRERRHAWLLVARNGSRCPVTSEGATPARLCRRLAAAAGGMTASVDAGRILTVAPGGVVRLLSTRGRVLRTWRLGPGIVNARLRGRTLAVQQGVSLDVYDAATGAKKQSLPLAPDEGPRPFLLDVQGDLVVYATGGAIHLLRLSDGRDLAIDLPGAAPWLDARLEPSGLFVTWNQMYHRRPGRLAFVPMRTVIQGFDGDRSIRTPS